MAAQFKNLMEILQIVPKTNCRKCNEKTCMAFAAAVFKGDRELADCPMVLPETAQKYSRQPQKANNLEQDRDAALAAIKQKIRDIDLADAARRTGGIYNGKRLTLKVMGKDFSVDAEGNLFTDIHVNPWVAMPLLVYILHCKGTPVSGNWTAMRELPHGKDWAHFFQHQCEKPLKKLADTYTDLFEDLVDIFSGKKTDSQYQADVSVVLHPLPLIPMMICYWRPEEGMDANLNLFFDTTAEDNLGIEGIYSLGTGIVRMFEKLALRHGVAN